MDNNIYKKTRRETEVSSLNSANGQDDSIVESKIIVSNEIELYHHNDAPNEITEQFTISSFGIPKFNIKTESPFIKEAERTFVNPIADYSIKLSTLLISLMIGFVVSKVISMLSKRKSKVVGNVVALNALTSAMRAANGQTCSSTMSMSVMETVCQVDKGSVICSGQLNVNLFETSFAQRLCYNLQIENSSHSMTIDLGEISVKTHKEDLYTTGDFDLEHWQRRDCAESGSCNGKLHNVDQGIVIRKDYTERCGFWTCNCASAEPSCVRSHLVAKIKNKCLVRKVLLGSSSRSAVVTINGIIRDFEMKIMQSQLEGKHYYEADCEDGFYYGDFNDKNELSLSKFGAIQINNDGVRHGLEATLTFGGWQDLDSIYELKTRPTYVKHKEILDKRLWVRDGVTKVLSDGSNTVISVMFNGIVVNRIISKPDLTIIAHNRQSSDDCKTQRDLFVMKECVPGISMISLKTNGVYYPACQNSTSLIMFSPRSEHNALEYNEDFIMSFSSGPFSQKEKITVRTFQCFPHGLKLEESYQMKILRFAATQAWKMFSFAPKSTTLIMTIAAIGTIVVARPLLSISWRIAKVLTGILAVKSLQSKRPNIPESRAIEN